MHQLTLLADIAIALVVAFVSGLAARRAGLPTIVGYLLGGIIIGPFTPGFSGDTQTIGQLAELGVIFLMFGVGLHFSLNDLWRVRTIVIPGALIQMALAALLGLALSQLWGWALPAGLVLGLAISISSTVMVLRGLMDNGLLNSTHGRTAVGWLVVEDLATVLVLVLMPAFTFSGGTLDWAQLGLTLLKVGGFILLLFFAGKRFIPWLLLRIARTRSRELFILSILAISLGTALGAAEVFGVSLALGAFAAGVVVNESPFSHQVGADLEPFREAFSVLFFVSVGMLVNPSVLLANGLFVLLLTALIMLGKPLNVFLLGLALRWPAHSVLVVAAGLSQVGEFSFILGQAGVVLGFLQPEQYALILAGALISITLNPLVFRLVGPLERWLKRLPGLWRRLDGAVHLPELDEGRLAQHVVIVGYGRVGRHIANLLQRVGIAYLVVEEDANRVEELAKAGTPALYGDAANSEILKHAGLQRSRALVIAGPDEAASELVVATARELAPQLPVIARAITTEGLDKLTRLGARYVIHPELEGGLEMASYTLLELGFPPSEIYRYNDAVRRDHYDLEVSTEGEKRILEEMVRAAQTVELTWLSVLEGSPLVGQTLAGANLRAQTGASVVVILRDGKLLANPKSHTAFQAGDRLGFIAAPEQVAAVEEIIGPGQQSMPQAR